MNLWPAGKLPALRPGEYGLVWVIARTSCGTAQDDLAVVSGRQPVRSGVFYPTHCRMARCQGEAQLIMTSAIEDIGSIRKNASC